MNFNKLKRQEYLEERNWTMEMARFDNQTKGEYFTKLVTLKNSIQADKKAEFETAMSLAEFNAQKEMNTWNMAMKEKEFNAEQEDRAFDRKMKIEANNRAIAQSQYEAQMKPLVNQLSAGVSKWESDKKAYLNIMDYWYKIGNADSKVISYLKSIGQNYVPTGGTFSYYGDVLRSQGAKLDNAENIIKEDAYSLGMYDDIYKRISSVNTPSVSAPSTSSTTVTYNRDESGNVKSQTSTTTK
jgi:hypothetical protein